MEKEAISIPDPATDKQILPNMPVVVKMMIEVKETKTLKEMERTMRQLEELTAMRFDVLESANAKNLPKEANLERLNAKEEKKQQR